jgi:hypothetical protein
MKQTGLFEVVAVMVIVLTLPGCAALEESVGDILAGDPAEGGLEESEVVYGIREALRVGTDNTVTLTSRIDGYLGNELIRIAMPEQLESMASTMRQAGLGVYVDELETGMNRAAELAAAEAREIFWNAIREMSISDAFGILHGDENAATEYFRRRTWTGLQERFHPIVELKMEEIGLSRQYGRVADAYNGLPFTGTAELVDLDEYVTEKALEGLFTVLAQEERKIREDPAARTSEILRRVFGSV